MKLVVLSTGRCGTTYLASVLSTYLRMHVAHQSRRSRTINLLSNIAATRRPGAPSSLQLADLLSRRAALPASTDPLRALMYAILLHEGYMREPDLRIVHLVRDPRDFVTSFMNWKSQRRRRWLLHHVIPFWQPNPWLVGELPYIAWRRMRKPEHFAWVWMYKNRYFDKLKTHPGYVLVRFEDLTNPVTRELTLRKMLPTGTTSRPQPIIPLEHDRNSSRGLFPHWREWGTETARQIDAWCKGLMVEYGYGEEPEWREMVGR